MVVKKDRVVVIGKDAVRLLYTGHALVEQPSRGAGLIFGHDPNGERLAFCLGLLDHLVDQREVVLALGRFKLGPRPAKIGHGGMGILLDRRRMTEAKMEVRKPHTGVG